MDIQFSFDERTLTIEALKQREVLTSIAANDGKIFVYLDDSSFGFICTNSATYQSIAQWNNERFPTRASFVIHCSNDNRFAAITCTLRGNHEVTSLSTGVVIEVSTGREILTLSNGDYHTEHTPFPVCFVFHHGRNLLVHATDWCRLDITDLESGKLLTERNLDDAPDLSDHDDSVFTEWPGELKASPNLARIATIGWVWHPVGQAYSIDLNRWLAGSTWESDSSLFQTSYAIWDYFWDSPFCWLDDTKLCIWGAEELGDNDIPNDCAVIFNAETGEKLFGFTGPTMDIFFYDQFLFSGLREGDKHNLGLSIWSIEDGSLLCQRNQFVMNDYIYESREFVEFRKGGKIILTKWQVNESN